MKKFIISTIIHNRKNYNWANKNYTLNIGYSKIEDLLMPRRFTNNYDLVQFCPSCKIKFINHKNSYLRTTTFPHKDNCKLLAECITIILLNK